MNDGELEEMLAAVADEKGIERINLETCMKSARNLLPELR
jgi:hypothetical protein